MHDDTAPTVPGYTLETLIGRGGSSQVWRATGPQGVVAIKVGLEPSVTGRAEWRMLRRHAGPHVVEALDLVTADDGRSCLVLEYMAGGNLDDVVRGRGGLTAGECVTVLAPVASTLAGFHERACVHGDLTPRNVLFDHQGRPAVADLGATRVVAQPEAADWATCGFAAPEVADGEAPTAAADVYAFGALAWFCLLAQAPPVAALRPHLRDLLPDTPAELVELITACLAQTPSSRPHAADLATRLRAVATPHPVPVPRERPDGAQDVEAGSITRRIRDEAQRHQASQESQQSARGSRRRGRRDDAHPAGSSRRAGASRTGDLTRSTRTRRSDGPATRVDGGRAGRWAALAMGAAIVTGAATWPLHHGEKRLAVRAPAGNPHTGASSLPVDGGAPGRGASPAVKVAGASPSHAEVSALLSCRATAWNSLDAAGLATCLKAGSAAHTQDATAFTTAARRGVHYRGLSYAVGPLTPVTCTDGDACVTADVTGSGYDVVHDGATQHVAARKEPVRLTLARDGAAWRITAWGKR